MNIFCILSISIIFFASFSEGFTVSASDQTSKASPTQLFFQDDQTKTSSSSETTKDPGHIIKGKKAYITKLNSLEELQRFLEEDDRMAAIKFYAPWCKTCQRLGLQFQKLATEFGDGVASRKMVEGSLRFAEVTFSPQTNHFIQDQLKVQAVPTLQLYHGLHKLWQRSGTKDTHELRDTVLHLESKTAEELLIFGEEEDDGILQHAIEDTMYDYPSFLDEEW